MPDGFENLKEKYYKCMINIVQPSGIVDLKEHPAAFAETIASHLNLTDAHTKERIAHGIAFIDTAFASNEKDDGWCSIDEYVETFSWHLLKKPRSVADKWDNLFNTFFDVFDPDCKGHIDAEQFGILYMPMSGMDKESIARAFAVVDKNNVGMVSRKQFVSAFVKYFTDPDIPCIDLPLF